MAKTFQIPTLCNVGGVLQVYLKTLCNVKRCSKMDDVWLNNGGGVLQVYLKTNGLLTFKAF